MRAGDPVEQLPSKAVQLQTHSVGESREIVALCEDGSIFIRWLAGDRWTCIEPPFQKPSTRKPREQQLPLETILPDWLSREDWNAWLAHRKAIKKPVTPEQIPSALAEMRRLHDEGYDVGDTIHLSIANGWQGLFPRKEGRSEAAKLSDEEARRAERARAVAEQVRRMSGGR
jgi:hypothetical protein